jgi:predicted Zn finger-like uncharacterized protein
MTIICPNCSARLQLDDSKVPTRAFSVRCPKCQNTIHANPPNESPSANAQTTQAASSSPATPQRDKPRTDRVVPAPAYKLDNQTNGAAGNPASNSNPSSIDTNDLVALLASALQRGSQQNNTNHVTQFRRTLVCTAPNHRETVARGLAENGYEVYVAMDTAQAIERMSKDRIDLIILDPEFDPVEQGATFITREISTMLPSERRRVFLVQLSAGVKTADAHAAFINHANLVVNPSDIGIFNEVLDLALRDFTELYRDFNEALRLTTTSSN